jgi:hypothetical protein
MKTLVNGIALKQGCYETTISPVFWSTQPICGHSSLNQKSINLPSFSVSMGIIRR